MLHFYELNLLRKLVFFKEIGLGLTPNYKIQFVYLK